MINKIKLSSPILKEYTAYSDNSTNSIEHLSNVNIFIGGNNSGKSRLIRELFGNDDIKYLPYLLSAENYNDEYNYIKSLIADTNKEHSISSSRSLQGSINKLSEEVWASFNNTSLIENFEPLTVEFKSNKSNILGFYDVNRRNNYSKISGLINEIERFIYKYENVIKDFSEAKKTYKKIYIPILRGLNHPTKNGNHEVNDIYLNKTKQDYFPAQNKSHLEHTIYTGLDFFKDISFLANSAQENRFKKKNFEKFLSTSFFNNKFVEVTAENNGKLLILIEDEEQPIEQLGDGIQSVIVLTYPLFIHQGEDVLFFIEEPETHLHPGFQRLFIETLNRPEFSSFQYFITTHSNHFLDLTIENSNASIYTLKKEKVDNKPPRFLIENVASGDDNILQLIGANKSSVFLSNCTIWVEGITDRIYLRKYIDLYIDHMKSQDGSKLFKEDTHYSFVEYGGNNITHWSFLDSEDEHNNININKLCGKAFLITDSDGASNKDDGKPSKKKLRQEKLQDRLNDRYYCLKSREIENLLTKEVIQQTLLSLEPNSTLDFKNFLDKKTDIIHEPIGRLIQEKVNGLKRAYAAESGTIKNKVEFAKKAVEYLKNYDDLSDEAKILSEKIYAFIYKENS